MLFKVSEPPPPHHHLLTSCTLFSKSYAVQNPSQNSSPCSPSSPHSSQFHDHSVRHSVEDKVWFYCLDRNLISLSLFLLSLSLRCFIFLYILNSFFLPFILHLPYSFTFSSFYALHLYLPFLSSSLSRGIYLPLRRQKQ